MRHVALTASTLALMACDPAGSSATKGAAPSAATGSTSATVPSATASAAAAPPPTGRMISSVPGSTVARGSVGERVSTLRVQSIRGATTWLALGGSAVHLCSWTPTKRFACRRVDKKLPHSGPVPTTTLTDEPPFLLVDDTTYDQKGMFDPAGVKVSSQWDDGATRYADGSLAVTSADFLARYASPGRGARKKTFAYPRAYESVSLVGETLFVARGGDGARALYERRIRSAKEDPGEEQAIGVVGDIERVGSSPLGCVVEGETTALLIETKKDYSNGRPIFASKQGGRWIGPIIGDADLPALVPARGLACGGGAVYWAGTDPAAGKIHHLACSAEGCRLTTRGDVIAKQDHRSAAVAWGDQVALLRRTSPSGGKGTYTISVAAPAELTTASEREVLPAGEGGAQEVQLVGGREHLLILVRPHGTDGWSAYELDQAGAVRRLSK